MARQLAADRTEYESSHSEVASIWVNASETQMAVSEMIAEAWKAVKDAGVPENLQEVAFKEAMEELRAARHPIGKPCALRAAADAAVGTSDRASKQKRNTARASASRSRKRRTMTYWG